jgi:hypothetical protein
VESVGITRFRSYFQIANPEGMIYPPQGINVSDKDYGEWLLFMKPVQFIGAPAVPGGLRVPDGALCSCVGHEKRRCVWKFDSFGDSVDVFGLLDWHVGIPSKWTAACGNSTTSKKSNTGVDWVNSQDYLDRGFHRITSKTAWTTEAWEAMLALCQESGVSFFQRFLTGTIYI